MRHDSEGLTREFATVERNTGQYANGQVLQALAAGWTLHIGSLLPAPPAVILNFRRQSSDPGAAFYFPQITIVLSLETAVLANACGTIFRSP